MRLLAWRRRLPPGAVGAMVFVVLLALGGVATLAIERMGRVDAAPGHVEERKSVVAFACGQVQGADPYCARIAADLARRVALSDAQRDRMAGDVAAINDAVRTPLRCRWPVGRAPVAPTRCSELRTGEEARRAPGPDEAEAVRRSLAAAGFADATVRIAGAEDPAPLGSIVYGVPAGAGCVVGATMQGIDHPALPVGRLPDGRCLQP